MHQVQSSSVASKDGPRILSVIGSVNHRLKCSAGCNARPEGMSCRSAKKRSMAQAALDQRNTYHNPTLTSVLTLTLTLALTMSAGGRWRRRPWTSATRGTGAPACGR